MGGGASAHANVDEWDDVPVNKADLHPDGSVSQLLNHQALTDQMSFTTDFGRLSPESRRAENPHAQVEADVLRAQAAAHWHRIISHTRDQRLAAHQKGEETPCPLCGQMTDDPQFCGFCGDIEEATQEQLRIEKQRTQLEHKQERGASPSSSTVRILGSFLGSARNLLGAGSADANGSPTSARSGSPSSDGMRGSFHSKPSFRRTSNTEPSNGSPGTRGRGSSLIDIDAEKEDIEQVLGGLLETSLTARNRGKGSEYELKSANMLRARIAQLEQEEQELNARAARAEAARVEQERLNAVRKFVGLGLDSESSSDSDEDWETRRLRKELKHIQAAGNSNDDADDSDADGATAWERSPFYRLLNVNVIKATKEKYGAGKKAKKALDVYDKEEEEQDLMQVGEPPFPPLPPVEVGLKRRDAGTIELVWDVTTDAIQMLDAVRQAYGKRKSPIYQLQYRAHSSTISDPSTGGSTKSGALVDDHQSDWKLAIKRSNLCGGVVSGLQPNTAYQFRCRRIGWCPSWEATIPVVIRSGPGPPSQPRHLASREVSSTSILLSWQIPEKDNGLPVQEYIVYMKAYGGQFEQVYTGRERCHLSISLQSNAVHVFQVQAVNKAGKSPMSERFAVRTLPAGAAALSPWVEMVDERAHKVFYCHTKTSAIAWKLPEGGILDEAGSFKNKLTYLLNQMARRAAQLCIPYGVPQRPIQIKVNRAYLLEQSLRILHQTPSEDIEQGPIRVHFEGEDGLDAGGLAKDWFVESKRLFDDSTGLLTTNHETGFITIDQRAASIHSVAESIRLFRAVGRFFAKAIIDGHTLGINLDPLLLCLMGGREPRLDGPGATKGVEVEEASPAAEANIGCMHKQGILQLTEPQIYRGLKWVQNNDVTYADLTFTCSYELFDESQTVELVPGGTSKPVTEENKEEYVKLMTNWLLRDRYEPAITSFMEGFSQHINVFKYMRIFTLQEIQLMIGGVPDIDVKELLKNAAFGGYVSASDQVEWLFQLLEEFDRDKMCKFLGFVTGCTTMPVDGLKPPLMITRMEDGTDKSLPKAHTCFNQLVIPRYSTAEILKERLLYALDNASSGFYLS